MELPHLNYLRSFEASARSLSFTAAATELNLSQAAVSGHIRALEQFVGGPLFVRHARSLSLTMLGTAYLPTIQQALSLIEVGTDSIVKRQDGRKVVISCPVTLAETWLSGVVTRLTRDNPQVSVTIHARIWRDEPPEIADLIIGTTPIGSLSKHEQVLWRETVVLCCAPEYRVDGKIPRSNGDLAQSRLIQTLSHTDYLQLAADGLNVAMANFSVEPTYVSSFSTALALAREGHGVAVVPLCYAARYLADGTLVEPLAERFKAPYATTCTRPDANATDTVKRAFSYIVEESKGAFHAP